MRSLVFRFCRRSFFRASSKFSSIPVLEANEWYEGFYSCTGFLGVGYFFSLSHWFLVVERITWSRTERGHWWTTASTHRTAWSGFWNTTGGSWPTNGFGCGLWTTFRRRRWRPTANGRRPFASSPAPSNKFIRPVSWLPVPSFTKFLPPPPFLSSLWS